MKSAICIDGEWPADLRRHNSPCAGELQLLPLPPLCYNPTIYPANDGLRLIVKAGNFNAKLWAIPLDAALDGDDCSLRLVMPDELDQLGHEDARHFRFREDDYIAFALVEKVGERVQVRQAVARLGRDLASVSDLYRPDIRAIVRWEKNWGFFECQGTLYVLYSIWPWIVHRVRGFQMGAAFRHTWAPLWAGGWLRGGASPVLHDGLFWCFFHGALDTHAMPTRIYTVGALAFEAKRPFRPVCYTKQPIMVPPIASWNRFLGVSVLWSGGAVWHNGRWLLSLGVHELFCAVATVDHQALQKELTWL